MDELKRLELAAKATAGLWHRRAMEEQDIGYQMVCDDMHADAADWFAACSWVRREAQAELDAGQPGQFCELGTALVEETADGAAPEELLVFVWAVVGEPPETEADLNSGEDSAEEGADEAEVEAGTEDTDVSAVGAGADVEGPAKEAKAEAVAVRLKWPRHERDQGGTLHTAVGAVVGLEGGGLRGARQGRSQEGFKTTAVDGEAVASRPRKWKERKRLFDPGG
eukprot:SAG11_NODE_634_length_8046_cov_8.096011_7_plen_224_part_00